MLRGVGATIGKYRLIMELGRGGMASAYLSSVHGPDGFHKLVVLKVLHPNMLLEPDGLHMFRDEARLAARLNHPNVVITFEVGAEDDAHYLAMEYLEGQSLSSILKRSAGEHELLSLQLRVLVEALAGLHYAHELTDYDGGPLRAVHRDVSPSNVVVTYDGRIKLLDFGIAKVLGNTVQTESGIVRGTVGYMAPEQILDEPLDRRADVYAVGVMLWEALARKRMWEGVREVLAMRRVLNGDIARPGAVHADVPTELERICMRALSRDRDARYTTAAEMQSDMEAFLDGWPSRIGPRECGKLVADLFAKDRATVRAGIEARMAQFARAKVKTPGRSGRSITPRPHSGSSAPPKSVEPLAAKTAPLESTSRRALRQATAGRRSLTTLGSIALLAAVGAVIVPVALQRSAHAPTAPTSPAKESPRPSTIRVHLAATPSNARLALDGALLEGNPVEIHVPPDSKSHVLVIEAPGYVRREERIPQDTDRELTFTLVPAPDADL